MPLICNNNNKNYDNRPYAYDVIEGRPRVLGVKRGTATCAIAKHAASGPTPACHTAGLARARALTERLSANALCQHNTCAQRDKSWPPTWRRCYGDVTSMHKVYCHDKWKQNSNFLFKLFERNAKLFIVLCESRFCQILDGRELYTWNSFFPYTEPNQKRFSPKCR